MTLPDEEARAIMWAGKFLTHLLDPKKMPKIPRTVRLAACSVLRHYPTSCSVIQHYGHDGEKAVKLFENLQETDGHGRSVFLAAEQMRQKPKKRRRPTHLT